MAGFSSALDELDDLLSDDTLMGITQPAAALPPQPNYMSVPTLRTNLPDTQQQKVGVVAAGIQPSQYQLGTNQTAPTTTNSTSQQFNTGGLPPSSPQAQRPAAATPNYLNFGSLGGPNASAPAASAPAATGPNPGLGLVTAPAALGTKQQQQQPNPLGPNYVNYSQLNATPPAQTSAPMQRPVSINANLQPAGQANYLNFGGLGGTSSGSSPSASPNTSVGSAHSQGSNSPTASPDNTNKAAGSNSTSPGSVAAKIAALGGTAKNPSGYINVPAGSGSPASSLSGSGGFPAPAGSLGLQTAPAQLGQARPLPQQPTAAPVVLTREKVEWGGFGPAPAATPPAATPKVAAPAKTAEEEFDDLLNDDIWGDASPAAGGATPAATPAAVARAPVVTPTAGQAAVAAQPAVKSVEDEWDDLLSDDAFNAPVPAPTPAKPVVAQQPAVTAPSQPAAAKSDLDELDDLFSDDVLMGVAPAKTATPAPALVQSPTPTVTVPQPASQSPQTTDAKKAARSSLRDAENLLEDLVGELSEHINANPNPQPELQRKASVAMQDGRPMIQIPGSNLNTFTSEPSIVIDDTPKPAPAPVVQQPVVQQAAVTVSVEQPKPVVQEPKSDPVVAATPMAQPVAQSPTASPAAAGASSPMAQQQALMLQMQMLQQEFLQFQMTYTSNPGIITPQEFQEKLRSFQTKLAGLQKEMVAAAAAGSAAKRPASMAPLNASSPAEFASVSSPASASPTSSSTTSPAPTTAPVRPTYEAPKRSTIGPDISQAAKGRYLKTGFILKLGGKKAFGQKWQLRKCTVTTNGDLEWYIPDPNDQKMMIFKGKMNLAGATMKEISDGHPDYAKLRKTPHKNIPKDNPDFMSFFSLYSGLKNKTYFFAIPKKHLNEWKSSISEAAHR